MKSNLIKFCVITAFSIIALYSSTQAIGNYNRGPHQINGVHGPHNNQEAKRGAALNKNQNKNQTQNAATATAVHNNNVNTQTETQVAATQAQVNQNTVKANEARSTIQSIIKERAAQSSQ